MRIIKESSLKSAGRIYSTAQPSLDAWRKVVRASAWRSLTDVRRTFPQADSVLVASGRRVIIFNIAGNNYRLITALHYDRQIAYILSFLTHAEYSKDQWKHQL